MKLNNYLPGKSANGNAWAMVERNFWHLGGNFGVQNEENSRRNS